MRVIIASRMSSTRLPGKALRKMLGNLSMLDILLHRINKSQRITGVILATSSDASDDQLAEWASQNNVEVYRGSLNDVLGRLAGCVEAFKLSSFTEILGDNPLVDPADIDRCIEVFERNEYDYVATSTMEYKYAVEAKSYPIGVRVQCMKSSLIKVASERLHDPKSREHSSSFIYGKDVGYKVKLLSWPHDRKDGMQYLNLAVNTQSDFDSTAKIFGDLGLDVSLKRVLTLVPEDS